MKKTLLTLSLGFVLQAQAATSVRFSSTITSSSLSGLKNDISRAANRLQENDERVIIIDLSSGGGDLQASLRFVGEVYSLASRLGVQIDTRVTSSCESACTILYTAGQNRLASRSAQFGFHSPKIESRIPSGMNRADLLDRFRRDWLNAIGRVDGGLAYQLEDRGFLLRDDMQYISASRARGGYVTHIQ